MPDVFAPIARSQFISARGTLSVTVESDRRVAWSWTTCAPVLAAPASRSGIVWLNGRLTASGYSSLRGSFKLTLEALGLTFGDIEADLRLAGAPAEEQRVGAA